MEENKNKKKRKKMRGTIRKLVGSFKCYYLWYGSVNKKETYSKKYQ